MAGQTYDLIEHYGTPGGVPILYLHGTPGTPAEAGLIEATAREHGVELWAIDRTRVAPGRDGEDYLLALAELVRELGGGRRLPILGFSIGAALALRVSTRLGAMAGPLLLLSAAGPLDLPAAFDGMGAGARLFRLARRRGAGFEFVVRGQAWLADHMPGALKRMLFASAGPSDRAFTTTVNGKAVLTRVLGSAWACAGAGYRRDLLAYVEDWSRELASVTVQVEMWHGVGDTWAPIGMAQDMARRLPAATRLHLGQGEHYSTLIGSAAAAFTAVCHEYELTGPTTSAS